MASVNKVIVLGNLGRDPDIKYLPSGEAVANITVATSRSWKNKDSGERQEETEWHRVSFFGRLAEVAGEYLKKGNPVYVEGRLRTRKWADKDGKDNYTTEIVAESMQLLGGKPEGGGQRQERAPQRQQAPARRASPPPTGDDPFDDIDF